MKRLVIISMVIILVGLFLSNDLFADSERVIEKEFKIGFGKKLELDIETGGSIDISGWDKKLVAVTVRIGGRHGDDVDVDFDENSSGLEIHSYFGDRDYDRSCRISFEIKVPERFDLYVDTYGGGIAVNNVEGKISGETKGGSLDLERIKGKVHMETMGGGITVEDCEVEGKVKTMGGSVLVKDVRGNLQASTMGGEVKYINVSGHKGKSDDDELVISTMGGDIELDYAGRKVQAKTYGGDIDVTKCKEVNVSTMGGDIDVQDAPGGAEVKTMGGDIKIRHVGEYVKATTMGGDIEIDEIDGWIKATTMGGDVSVTMVGDPEKGKRDVEIKSMSGDIELEVPDGLSMEFDIELAYTKSSRRTYKIVSDFEMNIEETDEWERKGGSKRKYIYGTGTVGDGEHLIKIRTVNGNIYIRRGK